jgi:hypothetical protein
VNNYYPQPQANYYYQQQHYRPQPQYNNGGQYYDNRSHQGLAGGVLGNVLGYDMCFWYSLVLGPWFSRLSFG